MPHFASQWARLMGECLFLPDYGPLGLGLQLVLRLYGAVRSAILATAGLLVLISVCLWTVISVFIVSQYYMYSDIIV